MFKFFNADRPNSYSEDEYKMFALIEIIDTGDWYRKIDPYGDHSYSNIESQVNGVTKPSESDFNAKVTELKNAYASAQYKRERAKAYPSPQDQLDMLWHAIDTGKLDKTSDFYTTNKAVKDKYSKG
jgi:hypothetical protein